MQEEDELRYMQELFGVRGFTCEFNITEGLWTSRVTSHVPIRAVADLITPEAVRDAVQILHGTLRRSGIDRPRIAVSGLNPHAGDGGSIGREEIEVIAPCRGAAASAMAWRRAAPWSPDTVFIAARRGDFDAVVSMYHDQGQIADETHGLRARRDLAGRPAGAGGDLRQRQRLRHRRQGHGAGGRGLQYAFELCARMAVAGARLSVSHRFRGTCQPAATGACNRATKCAGLRAVPRPRCLNWLHERAPGASGRIAARLCDGHAGRAAAGDQAAPGERARRAGLDAAGYAGVRRGGPGPLAGRAFGLAGRPAPRRCATGSSAPPARWNWSRRCCACAAPRGRELHFERETWELFEVAARYRDLIVHECTYIGPDRHPYLIAACDTVLRSLVELAGLEIRPKAVD
jgi:hypothetical protein